MSFGLGILALDDWTDGSEVAAMAGRCQGAVHPEGDLDQRIVDFYERLRVRFPEEAEGPWMDTPLDVGIDHVFVLLSYGEGSDPAIRLIQELAAELGLTIWDPQDSSAHRPVIAPTRADVETWWRDLITGAEVFDLVQPWVEESDHNLDDPITSMGLQYLHGLALGVDVDRAGTLLERWLAQGRRFDADPEAWQRDRLVLAVQGILREQGPGPARLFAHRLVATGALSPEDAERGTAPPAAVGQEGQEGPARLRLRR